MGFYAEREEVNRQKGKVKSVQFKSGFLLCRCTPIGKLVIRVLPCLCQVWGYSCRCGKTFRYGSILEKYKPCDILHA